MERAISILHSYLSSAQLDLKRSIDEVHKKQIYFDELKKAIEILEESQYQSKEV